jgi:hypothetical protein
MQQNTHTVKALERADTHLGIIRGRGGDENLHGKKYVIGSRNERSKKAQ